MAKVVKKKPNTKELDRVFSIFIRQRDMDINGFNSCFTCGTFLHWTRIQCGHFQSRRHMSTRWHEMNCQPQCVACNVFRHGEQFKFGKQLDNVYGKGTATVLEQLSKQIVKYSVDETKTLIQKYKQLIKEG